MMSKRGNNGRVPGGPIQYPTFGSAVAKELAAPDAELPSFVSIAPFRALSPAAYEAGFLGPQYAPMVVGDGAFNVGPAQPNAIDQALKVKDLDLAAGINARRASSHIQLLDEMEQEFLAAVQENRAKVILSEAEIPLAIAEAFRKGNLGVTDYYNLRNIQADMLDLSRVIAGKVLFDSEVDAESSRMAELLVQAATSGWLIHRLPFARYLEKLPFPGVRRFEQALAYLLEHGDARSRLAAANLLRELDGRVRGVDRQSGAGRNLGPVLVATLRHDDAELRNTAVVALGRADPAVAVPALGGQLRAPDPAQRRIGRGRARPCRTVAALRRSCGCVPSWSRTPRPG